MTYYLITCRSLTYAQRAERILGRAGITAQILRSPKSISGDGCGYAVRVSERWLSAAMKTLKQEKLGSIRVYQTLSDGSYNEVEQI
ncbi:MAG: DUF3343 domain-containing protein [Oscillospiraceae bacterium]|nr:DUF3343 domain-containing protein [Oscillospiraceae bacterium]